MLCHLCASGEDILYTCQDERMAAAQNPRGPPPPPPEFLIEATCQLRCTSCPRSPTSFIVVLSILFLVGLYRHRERLRIKENRELLMSWSFTWKRLARAKACLLSTVCLCSSFEVCVCVLWGAILLTLSWFRLISIVYGFVNWTGEEKEWSF